MCSSATNKFDPLIDPSGFVCDDERDPYIKAEAEAYIGTLRDHVSPYALEVADADGRQAWNALVSAERHQRSTDSLETSRGKRADGEARPAFEWMNGLWSGFATLLSFAVPPAVSAIILMRLKFDFIALNPTFGLMIGALAVGGLFGLIDLRKRLKRQRAQNRYDQLISILAPVSLLLFVFLAGAAAYPESLGWMQPAEAFSAGAGVYDLSSDEADPGPDVFSPPRMVVLLAMTLFDIFAGAMIHRFAHDRLTPPLDDKTSHTSEYAFITDKWTPEARARLDAAVTAKSDLEHRQAMIEAGISRHKAGAASHYDRLRARYEADIALAKADALDVMARDHVAGLLPLHSATSLNGGSHDTAH